MNNKTKQVLCEMQVLDEEVNKSVNNNLNDSILDVSKTKNIIAYYEVNTDDSVRYNGTHAVEDSVKGYTYIGNTINPDGIIVPTIETIYEETDDATFQSAIDKAYYIGQYVYEDITYDAWRVVEGHLDGDRADESYVHWEDNCLILTEQIVINQNN